MSDIEREERYIVIKRKYLDEASESALLGVIHGLDLPTEECVVVEHDWPNYDATWRSVQQVAEGTYDPDQLTRLQSEVERLRGRLNQINNLVALRWSNGVPTHSEMLEEVEQLSKSGTGRAWLLRKQAEAVEAEAREWNPDDQTHSGRKPHKELIAAAQRLRQSANEAENPGG